jgi:hypothetical protein
MTPMVAARPTCRVAAALGQQLLVGAALDDAAGLHHQDLVRVDHGGQAVRDDQRGLVLRGALQFRLDGALVGAVQGRRGLVEDQDRRVLQQRAGDGHALLLAAGQLEAALAHHGLVALGRGLDEGVDARGARGFFHLGAAGAGAAVGDVVFHRVVEQHRVLRHDADGAGARWIA